MTTGQEKSCSRARYKPDTSPPRLLTKRIVRNHTPRSGMLASRFHRMLSRSSQAQPRPEAA
jgi:hypothetical protein